MTKGRKFAPYPGAFALPALARALTLRIVLLLLIVITLTLTSITVFVLWQNSLEQNAENTSANQMINARLRLLQDGWRREAEIVTTSIELQRIASLPDEIRWHSLRALLVSMGENISFDTVMVRNQAGQILFTHGHESDELTAMPPSEKTAWFYSRKYQEMHAVLHVSLWLGPEMGRGEIIYLQPIKPSTLQLIGSAIRPVYLAAESSLLISSDGIRIPATPGAEYQLSNQHWRNLAVPISGVQGAHFLVRLPNESPLWFRPILIGALLFGLTLAAGIYLTFGRWARKLVLRIIKLDKAARTFADEHPPNLPATRAILRESQGNADEISTVAGTLESLMEAVSKREEESRAYLETLDLLEEVVIELDLDGVIQRASAAWLRLGGGHHDDGMPIPQRFQNHLHPDDVEQMQTVLNAITTHEKQQITLRARLLSKTASDAWVECRFVPLRDNTDQISGVRGVLRDVTQTYLQEKQISQMALHDALTGLPNRVLLEDRAKMAIRIAHRAQHKVGLCFFDLDHFKQINDTLGHKAGDRLLVALAEAMNTRLRGGDTLARWGGDEFVLLIPDIKSVEDLREVVAKIVEITQAPLMLDGAEFAISFSMGISMYPDDADNLDELLSQADRAMFYAKAQGRNAYQFFADMSQKGLGKKDLYIQHRLAAAIKNNEILTWFQPLIDAKTGLIQGVEALARWHDPELGWVSPASFIPMTENMGLIRELGEQVWTASLAAGQAWQASGLDLGLAVNISKRQLFMPDFTHKLIQDAARFGIAPQRITLEITESIALLDVEFAAERLNELNHAGFRIAIDDFGTGYSSLSQLHDMPVQELKIDISFVRRIHTPQGLRVVQAIIQMAAAMKLECVAEGVEDAATASLLSGLGVNTLQGFHFAKPMPLAEFDLWLDEYASGQKRISQS